jgi:hypothetical protein
VASSIISTSAAIRWPSCQENPADEIGTVHDVDRLRTEPDHHDIPERAQRFDELERRAPEPERMPDQGQSSGQCGRPGLRRGHGRCLRWDGAGGKRTPAGPTERTINRSNRAAGGSKLSNDCQYR